MSDEFPPGGGAEKGDAAADAMIGTALRNLESPRAVPEEARTRILEKAFSAAPQRSARGGHGAHDATDEVADEALSLVEPDEPDQRPSGRRPWLISAAAAGVVLVLGAVLVLSDGEEQLVTEAGSTAPSPVPSTTAVTEIDSAAVRSACAGFESSAFAPRTRGETTGPAQMEVLATYDEAAAAAEQLLDALLVLRQDLRAAGIDDVGVERELSTAIVALERLDEPTQNSGVRVDRVWGALTEVELGLVDLERRMIELGQTSCP